LTNTLDFDKIKLVGLYYTASGGGFGFGRGIVASKQTLKITCDTRDSLPLDSLTDFQGNLKTLSDKNFAKLKKQIIKHGFSFPFFVWRDGETNFILDGHQRLKVLSRMRADGEPLPEKFPVVFIEAKDRKEAKEKLLAENSQFGQFSDLGLVEFMDEAELDFEELSELELPGIDLESLLAEMKIGDADFQENPFGDSTQEEDGEEDGEEDDGQEDSDSPSPTRQQEEEGFTPDTEVFENYKTFQFGTYKTRLLNTVYEDFKFFVSKYPGKQLDEVVTLMVRGGEV